MSTHYCRLYRRPLFGFGFGGDKFGPLFASSVSEKRKRMVRDDVMRSVCVCDKFLFVRCVK